ncbi:MAG: hypothetical protein RI897_282 [Verrucomicrobiota bacterium]|jgi:hypothetical protein
MKTRFLAWSLGIGLWSLVLALFALWTNSSSAADEKTHKLQTVSLRKMAESLHAVIAANQQQVVDGAELAGSKVDQPSHAELLRRANLSIQQHGAEFSYTLRSLQPIRASAAPQTEVEQIGLEKVSVAGGEPFMTEETLGGRSYFTAVFPEIASRASCIECHNSHPESPRKDYRFGDVMGAIIIRIPLEF